MKIDKWLLNYATSHKSHKNTRLMNQVIISCPDWTHLRPPAFHTNLLRSYLTLCCYKLSNLTNIVQTSSNVQTHKKIICYRSKKHTVCQTFNAPICSTTNSFDCRNVDKKWTINMKSDFNWALKTGKHKYVNFRIGHLTAFTRVHINV